MIRTELLAVSAVRGEPQAWNVRAFAWTPGHPGNNVSTSAVLYAELEMDGGQKSTVVVRPGAAYAFGGRIRRLWLYSANPGTVAFEVAYDEGDSVLPSAGTFDATPTVTRYTVTGLRDLAASPLACTFRRPPWGRMLGVYGRLPPNAQTLTAKVYPLDSLGDPPPDLTTMTTAKAAVVLPTSVTLFIDLCVLRAGEGNADQASAGMDTATARGPVVSAPWLAPGGFRLDLVGNTLDAGRTVVLEGMWFP